uniref:Uncharacterized protein n=1 Tax=Salix viminalis TaxID=40686 RepID=A0A6N2N8K2_SALVM
MDVTTKEENVVVKHRKETESHQESKNQQGEENSGKLEEIINNNLTLKRVRSGDEDEVEADDQVKVEENEVSPEETVGEEKEEEGVKQSNEGSEEIKPQEKQDQVVSSLRNYTG